MEIPPHVLTSDLFVLLDVISPLERVSDFQQFILKIVKKKKQPLGIVATLKRRRFAPVGHAFNHGESVGKMIRTSGPKRRLRRPQIITLRYGTASPCRNQGTRILMLHLGLKISHTQVKNHGNLKLYFWVTGWHTFRILQSYWLSNSCFELWVLNCKKMA